MEEKVKGVEEKTLQPVPKWTWYVLIIFCVFLLILIKILTGGSSSEKDGTKETTTKTESTQIRYHWVVEKRDTIHFTGEYGEIYRKVVPGTNISFEGATEPYCIKNLSGQYCGQKNEDAGRQIPNSTDNGELHFKSQNGNAGYIVVVFWVLVKN